MEISVEIFEDILSEIFYGKNKNDNKKIKK